jgi:hypothetical protein
VQLIEDGVDALFGHRELRFTMTYIGEAVTSVNDETEREERTYPQDMEPETSMTKTKSKSSLPCLFTPSPSNLLLKLMPTQCYDSCEMFGSRQ